MKLYLVNAENIYFPQIKDYFKEIISSYDNGNYRSAMVMLYSTIVCDLLLKLKELSDVYQDEKAEKILDEINNQRKGANNSAWEWNLIEKIRKQTELLGDEAYAVIQHIYSWRNFSAHPAMNEDYELISPAPEIVVAYIKKALDDILTKPSVFAQNIVDRMSDDIAAKKEIYRSNSEAFEQYLEKVYFQRMSPKMINQVFKAFWKFVFVKTEGENFENNRLINRNALEAMLNKYCTDICTYIEQNTAYFVIAQDTTCLMHACILLAYFPHVYNKLDNSVKHQLKEFDAKEIALLKWFDSSSLEQFVDSVSISNDYISPNVLHAFERICNTQGQPQLLVKFLIRHYSRSANYTRARNRFDCIIEPYLSKFSREDFVNLLQAINSNRQIYNYVGQKARNDKILEFARSLLGDDFDYSQYPHFEYTQESKGETSENLSDNPEDVLGGVESVPDNDPNLPF